MAKRTEQMKKYVEYREQKQQEWNEQKPRRLELRNCKYIWVVIITMIIVYWLIFPRWSSGYRMRLPIKRY